MPAQASAQNTVQTRGALRRLSSAAIVAFVALPLLAACGQRGPLYLPTVPPLPAPPQNSGYATPNNNSGTANGANDAQPSDADTSSAPDRTNSSDPSSRAKGAQ
jgi:predicted small lipoprotein YifL